MYMKIMGTRNIRRALVIVMSVAGIVAAGSLIYGQQQRESNATTPGADSGTTSLSTTPVAPDTSVKLKGVDGKMYDLAQMRGEVVLLSFGATWCVPCAWELAAIEELKEEFKDRPVRFLWASIETKDEASDALLRHYAKQRRVTIPVLRDPERTTFAKFADRIKLPLVVLFDKEGRFTPPVHRGMSSEPIQYKNAMRTRLVALLTAQPGSPIKQVSSFQFPVLSSKLETGN